MTYTAGSTIEAADYNAFIDTNASAINKTWYTYTPSYTSIGWGQSALATVSAGATVNASSWASMVNTISAMANHEGTTITSRTAPSAGSTISILSNVSTDLAACYNNRTNCAALGSEYTSWTGTNSKTTATSGLNWYINIQNIIDFPSYDAARYFWNAGGIVKIAISKTSTGNTGDPEWNDLINNLCGDFYITSGTTGQVIAGSTYDGFKEVGGTGTPDYYYTGTGWWDLLSGSTTQVFKQFADTAPYTSNFVRIGLTRYTNVSGVNRLVVDTRFESGDAESDPISGGTAPSGTTPGTAPCAIMTYYPPATTYISNTWGTPTVSATVTSG